MPDAPPPRRWALPPDVHDHARLRTQADRRRAALEAGGCHTEGRRRVVVETVQEEGKAT